jgi:hypothetical protein
MPPHAALSNVTSPELESKFKLCTTPSLSIVKRIDSFPVFFMGGRAIAGMKVYQFTLMS